jgi:hypothetical protein
MPTYNNKKNSSKNKPISSNKSYEIELVTITRYLPFDNLRSSDEAIQSALIHLRGDLNRLKDALEPLAELTQESLKFFKIKSFPTGIRQVIAMISRILSNRVPYDLLTKRSTHTQDDALEVLLELQDVAASSPQRWTFGGRNKKITKAYAVINNFFKKNPPSPNSNISRLCEAIEMIAPPSAEKSTEHIVYDDNNSSEIDNPTVQT